MPTNLDAAVDRYLRAKTLSRGTRNEYHSTLRKWEQWGGGVPIKALQRKDVRAFLDWVYERAVADQGANPGRTVNKAREHLRAVLSWAWEQELIDAPPRFPRPRPQRDVAGRHYLTKAELNALYFATYRMHRPRGWDAPFPVGRYWRSALVVFFNYGSTPGPSGSRPRPTSRSSGGTCRDARFQELCELAGLPQRTNVETGKPEPWELKDLCKTCATYYDEHVPEVLGRDPRPLRRWDHVPALPPPRPVGVQGDHDTPAAERLLGTRPGLRRRVPVLPETLHRRNMTRAR